jgi:hypothetical protein
MSSNVSTLLSGHDKRAEAADFSKAGERAASVKEEEEGEEGQTATFEMVGQGRATVDSAEILLVQEHLPRESLADVKSAPQQLRDDGLVTGAEAVSSSQLKATTSPVASPSPLPAPALPAPSKRKPRSVISHSRSTSKLASGRSARQVRRRARSQSDSKAGRDGHASQAASALPFPSRRQRIPLSTMECSSSSSGSGRSIAGGATIVPALPLRKRCPSCSKDVNDDEFAVDNVQIAYGQALGDPLQAMPLNTFVAGDSSNPDLTFDDEDDSIWVHLALAGSPIKVKLDSSTPIGDARKLARLFAASLVDPSTYLAIPPSKPPVPIHFLPDGRAGQMLQSDRVAKDIFIEYPQHMTLSQARQVGDRLAEALQS